MNKEVNESDVYYYDDSLKTKVFKHIKIFLCVFVICTIALYGVWRLWFDPYRGR